MNHPPVVMSSPTHQSSEGPTTEAAAALERQMSALSLSPPAAGRTPPTRSLSGSGRRLSVRAVPTRSVSARSTMDPTRGVRRTSSGSRRLGLKPDKGMDGIMKQGPPKRTPSGLAAFFGVAADSNGVAQGNPLAGSAPRRSLKGKRKSMPH